MTNPPGGPAAGGCTPAARRWALVFVCALIVVSIGAAARNYLVLLIPPDASNRSPHRPLIAFIGDSLTIGNELPSGVPRYPEIVASARHAQHQNLGIPGITLTSAVPVQLARVSGDATEAVIYLGTNDLWQTLVTKNLNSAHSLSMKASYLFMLGVLRQRNIPTYTVLLRDYSKMPKLGSDPALAGAMSRWVTDWDAWLLRQRTVPIDLRCFPDTNDPRMYKRDEIHPTAEGNRLLANHVLEGIQRGGVTCP